MLSMGLCRGVGDCPHAAEAPFLSFTNTPDIPNVADVQGSVLLIGGGRGNGKTVYGHRLLHEYHARGLKATDLLRLGRVVKGSPARRHQVLSALQAEIDPFDEDESRPDDELWGEKLYELLGRATAPMAVRLPSVEQRAQAGGAEIVDEIVQYAIAAYRSKHVFIYEYLTDGWPDDWDRLIAQIDKNHDVAVQERVVSELSADDLWAYVDGVMRRFPDNGITLAPGMPEELQKALALPLLTGRRPIRLSRMHGLMRAAFDIAIAQDSAEVSAAHVISAAWNLSEAAA
ncbi:hypothetical protein E1200_15510 [Actinomadura sp. GC306]|uniref:hypothetical protein n=1 Tax=Actinomadura sp. GC306 TaxID=2530367 RepID=UPI00104C9F7E|nr:hypothetical protein [Actinomadura sp. GC306]TDC67150.1 hypothetical protein E1200_15510 [Actinomadura sp. GC306]